MIDYLSPREEGDLKEALGRGRPWPRVVACFLDGPRLLLGWDHALSIEEIARRLGEDAAAARAAVQEAARWCVGRRLHLLGWDEADGRRSHFMAVG